MKKIIFFVGISIPFIASAYAFPDFRGFSVDVAEVLDIVLNILITVAFIAFFWGVAKFILSSGNEKAITDGKQFMIYGILALFLLWTFKAIILFFSGQFEFGNELQNTQQFLPQGERELTPVVDTVFTPLE